MSTDPTPQDPAADPAPAPEKKESFREKLLHGLEDVGEAVGEVAVGGLIIAAEAGGGGGAFEGADVKDEPHPGHHGK